MAELSDDGLITADGTYVRRWVAGRKSVVSISGTLGGGSVAFKYRAPLDEAGGTENSYFKDKDGANVDLAASGDAWKFTSPQPDLVFVVTGSTTPVVYINVVEEGS